MPSALIQPCFEQALIWFKEQGIPCKDDQDSICENEKLLEKIHDEIRLHDQKFGKWEQVKAIRLTPEIWSVEEGHLTPTMKEEKGHNREVSISDR